MFNKVQSGSTGNKLELEPTAGVDVEEVASAVLDILGAPTFSAANLAVEIPGATATSTTTVDAGKVAEALVHAINPTAQPATPHRRRSRSRRGVSWRR